MKSKRRERPCHFSISSEKKKEEPAEKGLTLSLKGKGKKKRITGPFLFTRDVEKKKKEEELIQKRKKRETGGGLLFPPRQAGKKGGGD